MAELAPVPTALAAALACVLVAQFMIHAAPPPPPGFAPVSAAPPAVVIAPVADDPEILTRSLFSPTRGRPGPAGPAGADQKLSDYQVLGVTLARGVATAVVKAPGGQVESLHPGQSLMGWRVAAIRRDGLVIDMGGQRRLMPVAASAPTTALIR